MEKFNDIFGKWRKDYTLKDDEYIKDGVIYCKKCNTPRQADVGSGNEKCVIYANCKCLEEQRQKVIEAEEREARRMRIENARREAIIVPAYHSYRFEADDGKTPRSTQIAKNYVQHFEELEKTGQGLLFWGDVGTGKTFLALCIANALIDRGYKVKHTSLANVVKMAQDFDNADRHFERLMSKHCIIIDDLGTERATSFAEEQIYKFIDGCNTHSVAIVVTTNYTPKELEAAAADTSDLTYARIYSRLLEKCFPVKVNELKRREANATKNRADMATLLGIDKK